MGTVTVTARTISIQLPGDATPVEETVYDLVDETGRVVDTFLNQRIAEQYATRSN